MKQPSSLFNPTYSGVVKELDAVTTWTSVDFDYTEIEASPSILVPLTTKRYVSIQTLLIHP
jgi:hypothetical protein